MDRQIDNNTVFVSATENILYAGCDFRLFWAAAGLCFMAAVCLFAILPIPTSLYAMGVDALLFSGARWYLQQLAKSDPLAVPGLLTTHPLARMAARPWKDSQDARTHESFETNMTKAHQYEHGVSDLIQATALVDDGIVALKDGGLLAGWRYTGTSDMEAATVVRDRFAAVLDHGKGWVLETNAIRLPSTVYPAWGEFPDPVSRLIEAERIRNYTVPGRYFETQYYMTLAYFPPSHAGEKAKGWFYETPVAQGSRRSSPRLLSHQDRRL